MNLFFFNFFLSKYYSLYIIEYFYKLFYDCFFLDDLFQTLSSELGIPVLFDDEIPQRIDNNVDQIIKDIYIGESSNNFEESNIISQQNSGTSFFLLH